MTTLLHRSSAVSGMSPHCRAEAADCVLHLGMPKTATTMLQMHLFSRHSRIQYLGKCENVPEEGRYFNSVVTAFALDCLPSSDPRLSRELMRPMQELMRELRGQGKTIVFSKEGHASGGKRKKREQARLLHEVFGNCKIMFTVREPISYIEAMYFWHLRGYNVKPRRYRPLVEAFGRPPRYFTINQWLDVVWTLPERGAVDNLCIADTLEIYAKEFGTDRVGVFLFEQLKADSAQFMTELSQFLGIDPEESIKLAGRRSANERWDMERVDMLRKISGSFWRRRLYRLSQSQRNSLRRIPENGFSGAKPKAELSGSWRERLLEIGRAQSRKLEQDWGLPVRQLGYPM